MDDRLCRVVVQERLDEGLVDLDRSDWQALQVRERGVAGTEVVERETHAEVDEGLEAPQRSLGVEHDCALGDLQLDGLRWQPRTAHRGRDRVHELRVVHGGG